MAEITSIADFTRARSGDEASDARLKRLAIQIATQLPDDTQEALRVLEHAQTLVRTFLADSRPV